MFASVSLAANFLFSVGDGHVFDFLDSQTQEQLTFNSPEVQNIMKCIGPRSFSRLVINKGLLHSDPIVKHGTLKLVLEVLKLLELLIGALNSVLSSQGGLLTCNFISLFFRQAPDLQFHHSVLQKRGISPLDIYALKPLIRM
ncbi:hypothetical protein CQW23_24281 [Capsicum baccatum]|uniref:Uncharacterized protein n=1 Tax=Capsicum baccatum TaxID=33114 RepID=A0A2G2VUD8_CAPBA|nr:hypothetical protein CQW23_24281 [Capsicum baccatum]